MADRIFKGRLLVTGAVADENKVAFPEAAEDFNQPHAGGLVAYHMLYSILKDENLKVEEINGSVWISGDNAWIKVDPDGHIEFGIAGA